jgi:hypothetical protein
MGQHAVLDPPTTTADPVAEALTRVLGHYTGTPAVTVPDGWTLERIGHAWLVGPTDSGTHLIVTALSQIPRAIATFEQQLHRAAQVGATL